MRLLKNREVRFTLYILCAAAVFFTVLAFFGGAVPGTIMLAASVFFISVHLVSVKKRYDAIAKLSASIDLVLHGDDNVFITESREGELSLLESEISKVLLRLRENSERLKNDKLHLSDAIADISHQLRTPLTSINLTLSRLIGGNVTQEERIKLLYELRSRLSRIEWLVEALLKISKIDAGTAVFRSEPVSVADIVARASEPFAIALELKDQRLITDIGNQSFIGDTAWSTEAISNIIKNCMEHTPEGGYIKISAEETPLYTEIVIGDSGEGIDKADLPHLFERFYRGRNSAETSVGIGLALTRAIIAEQQGSIKAENSASGALFTIRFYKRII